MTSSYLAEVAGVRFRPSGFAALERAVDDVLSSSEQSPLTVGYVNPHVITSASEHPEIAEHLGDCDHVCIDGTGVWLALRLWRHNIERLPAYRAAEQLVVSGVLRGPTAMVGIEPDLIELAAEGIVARNSAIEIVGFAHGYRTDTEIAAMIAGSNPRVVLIGAGSPRSEQIAAVVRNAAPDAVIFHVGGGTLNAWAGGRKHAPRILSTLGVDWLYRFVNEPHTRSRYLKGIPAFIGRVVAEPVSLVVDTESTTPSQTKDQPATRQEQGVFS